MPRRKFESVRTDFDNLPSIGLLDEMNFGPDQDQLFGWLESLLALQSACKSEGDLAFQACSAIIDLVGLDYAMLVDCQGSSPRVIATSARDQEGSDRIDGELLARVKDQRATLFESTVPLAADDQSPQPLASVASPVFDRSDRIVRVLVAARRLNSASRYQGVRRLEALAVQLLAGLLGTHSIIENRQDVSIWLQSQLERFASPELIEAMTQDPDIFEPRQREITVLFADIQGFTGLTERVGAEKTFSMISNVMNQLTGCILDEKGFIMGYLGDGIAAMWNAPADQPDHAELACWAAVNMQKVMTKVRQFWEFVSGETLKARIGIATGTAHVGNAGSRWRMNYSALGSCVNFASRLEAANKSLGSSVLISAETKSKLFSRFDLQRIGPLLVKGMGQAEQVFELMVDPAARDRQQIQQYESVLQLIENRQFEEASRILVNTRTGCDAIDSRIKFLETQIESLRKSAPDEPLAFRLSEK